MSILVLGATIAIFLYYLTPTNISLIDIGVEIEGRAVIFFLVLLSFVILAAKRTFLSWRHQLKAQFIESELLGVPHTWEIIPRIDERVKEFMKYEYDKKLKPDKERRYYLVLHKIFMMRSLFYYALLATIFLLVIVMFVMQLFL